MPEGRMPEPLLEMARSFMEREKVPGLGIAWVEEDTWAAGGLGKRSLEEDLPVEGDTLFPLASLTKSFTAAVALLLEEEGVISLAQSPVEILPWFQVARAGAAQAMTLQMLLQHTSGLGRTGHLDPDAGASFSSREHLARALSSYPLQTAPGETWSYSNEGYSLAAHLVERSAGQPYEELVEDLLLKPLDLLDTTAYIQEWRESPLGAVGYRLLRDGGKAPWERVEALPIAPASTPAGRLSSTPRDMARYARAMLQGWRGILKESQRRPVPFGSTGWGYGLGWFYQPGPKGTVFHHGGNQRGFAHEMWIFPAEGKALVLLSNLTYADLKPLVEEIYRWAEGKALPLPKEAKGSYDIPSSSYMDGLSGLYRAPQGDVEILAGKGNPGSLLPYRWEMKEPPLIEEGKALPIGERLFFLREAGMPLYFTREGLLLAGNLYRKALR
ncbi:MAG: serine hydrolase domain-containing protein [Bacillota bacterium]|nr:serine hydrolase domain-containing protein [Bacillota bacterium]